MANRPDNPARTAVNGRTDRVRHDNITGEALDAYQTRYGEWVTKDHIFSYVYGILHSPDYRERYADDLAKLLPRIPEVTTSDAFRLFSEAGQQLLDLHIGYEEAEPYPLEERIAPGAPDQPDRYRVQKMRWGGSSKIPDHSMIIYNDWVTLAEIPNKAHEYACRTTFSTSLAVGPIPSDYRQNERHRQRPK